MERASNAMSGAYYVMDIIRIILAIFLPPVAAFLTVGIGLHFWLNLILTLFFFVPGMIHALWLVVKRGK
jgi:uncharacterized membrane protein YqaE (UPF0057 family)